MILIKSKIYYNYEYQNKFLGVVDYKSLIIFTVIFFSIISVSSLFNLSYRIPLTLILLFSPIGILFILCGNKVESGVDVFINVIRFYIGAKVYIYNYSEIKKNKGIFTSVYKKL